MFFRVHTRVECNAPGPLQRLMQASPAPFNIRPFADWRAGDPQMHKIVFMYRTHAEKNLLPALVLRRDTVLPGEQHSAVQDVEPAPPARIELLNMAVPEEQAADTRTLLRGCTRLPPPRRGLACV